MTWPTVLYVAGSALLASVIALFWLAVTVAVASCEVAPLPDAVALLVIEPASRSARVIVWVAVQEVDAAGANGPLTGQVIAPRPVWGSVTVKLVIVAVPVLVTR